jgi:hypothetical protein
MGYLNLALPEPRNNRHDIMPQHANMICWAANQLVANKLISNSMLRQLLGLIGARDN